VGSERQLPEVGLTGRAQRQDADEGGGSEQSDHQRAAKIRSILFNPRPADLGWTSGIQRPARSRRPGLSAAALLAPAVRSRRRRGHGHSKAPRGLGKNSSALRATWQTQPWARHRHRGTKGRRPRWGSSTAA
jgi:hypothetical protein